MTRGSDSQPADARTWFNLAMNLEQSGEMEVASTACTQVMELDPGGCFGELSDLGRNRIS